MGFIVSDCPHCGLANAQMKVNGVYSVPLDYQKRHHFSGSALTNCPKCHEPIAWSLERRNHNATNWSGEKLSTSGFSMGAALFQRLFNEPIDEATLGLTRVASWPEPSGPDIPNHVPESVVKPLLAAERNFPIYGNEEAAGAMYGRALEVALKSKFPELTGKLYDRIEKLAKNHLITADLKDWAHNIRDLRNDALHEVEELPRDQLTALRLFTLSLMEYLFTMPEHVRLAREETKTLEPSAET